MIIDDFEKYLKKSRNFDDLSRHEQILVLDSARKKIRTYVRTLTGKMGIRVEFLDEDEEEDNLSFTDGKTIKIGGSLVRGNYMPTVGVALHESSHIKLSNFEMLKDFEDTIPQKVWDIADDIDMEEKSVKQIMKNLWNWIEDRRIDYFIFSTSPGYKKYYHSMYDKYFRSEEVSQTLQSDMFRKETWDSYMHRIINLLNVNTDLDALENLREIWNTIDIANIDRLESSKDAMELAADVFELISEVAEDNSFTQQMTVEDLKKNAADELSEKIESGEIDPEDLISGEHCDKGSGKQVPISLDDLSEEAKQKILDAMQKQQDFLENDVDKDPVPAEMGADLDDIDSDSITYQKVGEGYGEYPKGVDVLTIRNINRNMIKRGLVPITREQPMHTESVNKGLRLGKVLGRKLEVRDEKRVTDYSRKRSGKLDKRLLASLSYDNENVFYTRHIDQYRDAELHISIDASGSMSGGKFERALVMSVAMAKALSMIQNIECTISFRTTHGSKPAMVIAYNSKKDPISKVKKTFPFFDTPGTTPEGLCFEAILDEIISMQRNKDVYFVNLSDGMPNFHGGMIDQDFYYGGEEAAVHTRNMMKKIKKHGIKVLSYYIGRDMESPELFQKMYGKDARVIDVTNITSIARTMNKKFLEK